MIQQDPLKLQINGIDTKSLNIEGFNTIEDFIVSIDSKLKFTSKSNGTLTEFPWFDNVNEAVQYLPEGEIPGLDGRVWDEEDQNWRVIIFQRDNFIVVLDANEPHGETIDRYYKVKLEDYKKAWNEELKKFSPRDKSLWKGWWHY